MKKQSYSGLIWILCLLLAILSVGCQKAKEEKIDLRISLSEVTALIKEGNYEQAISVLEKVDNDYPERYDVMKLFAVSYQRNGQFSEAAFWFSMLASVDATQRNLFENAATNYIRSGDLVAGQESYSKLLKEDPGNGKIWIELARILEKRQLNKQALNTYLRGVKLLSTEFTSDQAIELGSLFMSVGSYAQAEVRFKQALKDKEGDTLPAYIGLLKLYSKKKDWQEVEPLIEELEKQYPSITKTSVLVSIKENLRLFKEELEQERLAAEKKTEELVRMAEVEEHQLQEDKRELEQMALKNGISMPVGYQSEIPDDKEVENKRESEKESPVKTNYTTYKPIRMKKLPPVEIMDSDINIDEDAITIIADRVILDEPENVALEEDAIDPAVYDRVILDEPVTPLPEARENYFEIGKTLLLARDYTQAVGVFWKAINENAENAVLWYHLFTTYKLLDEGENAEMTILEAMRLDSKNESYLIDYLKIIRKLHPAPYFMEELVRANKKFPNNPTILLSLAKAFNSIQKKPGTAILAYKEFLRLYPKHPLRPNVEAAIASLGGR